MSFEVEGRNQLSYFPVIALSFLAVLMSISAVLLVFFPRTLGFDTTNELGRTGSAFMQSDPYLTFTIRYPAQVETMVSVGPDKPVNTTDGSSGTQTVQHTSSAPDKAPAPKPRPIAKPGHEIDNLENVVEKAEFWQRLARYSREQIGYMIASDTACASFDCLKVDREDILRMLAFNLAERDKYQNSASSSYNSFIASVSLFMSAISALAAAFSVAISIGISRERHLQSEKTQ